jgi:type IV secretory pathway TraG/TraD family ATPase VirD4
MAHWRATFRASSSTHLTPRDLLTPDEVMRLSAKVELLLQPGAASVIAEKVRHYADGEFWGMAVQGELPSAVAGRRVVTTRPGP